MCSKTMCWKLKNIFLPLGSTSNNIQMKTEFTVTHKRRLNDSVCIYGVYYKVSSLIESNPMLLWRAIHNHKNNNVVEKENGSIHKIKALSLVRPAYDLLKKAVAKIAPAEVAVVEDQFKDNKQNRKLYRLEKKLQQEIATGKIDTAKSRFKRI